MLFEDDSMRRQIVGSPQPHAFLTDFIRCHDDTHHFARPAAR